MCTDGIGAMDEAQKVRIFIEIFEITLLPPVISVSGVALAGWLKLRRAARLCRQGLEWVRPGSRCIRGPAR